ncbi:PIN domain-containing protein [Leptolyngbyaceae cyanobacterium UHCC 1019]
MRYLLDTCVISDFIKGEPGTQARLKQTSPADIAVSVITVMELRYGLALILNALNKLNLRSPVFLPL